MVLSRSNQHLCAHVASPAAQSLHPARGAKRVDEWLSLIDEGKWPVLVERLLLEHYDEGYTMSSGRATENLVETVALDDFSNDQIQKFVSAVTT